jgi:hypothetical protein
MTARLLEVIEAIPIAWKIVAGIVAAGGIVLSGFAATLSVMSLPHDVGVLKLEVAQLQDESRDTRLVLQEISARIKLSNCLTIKEKTGQDWRECLND